MNEQYRGFKPTSETLLGRVIQWKPTGSIAHMPSDRADAPAPVTPQSLSVSRV